MADNESFRFLDLPPEIRNTIYEIVFRGSTSTLKQVATVYEDDDDLFGTTDFGLTHIDSSGNSVQGQPGILFVSKQIRSEAVLCFYAGTTFMSYAGTKFVSKGGKVLNALLEWAGTLPPVMTAAMRDVRYEGWWPRLPGKDEASEERAAALERGHVRESFARKATSAGIADAAISVDLRDWDGTLWPQTGATRKPLV